MSAAYNVFNGSTLSFDGDAIGAIEDIEWHVGGQKVDVAGSDADRMEYGAGLDDVEVSVTVKGASDIARGDTGSLAVSWNTDPSDGDDTPDIDNALVNDVTVSGSKNGPITTKIQFVPAPEDD